MKTKTGKSTYTWNERVMNLARRVGDGIRERERDERLSAAVNIGA